MKWRHSHVLRPLHVARSKVETPLYQKVKTTVLVEVIVPLLAASLVDSTVMVTLYPFGCQGTKMDNTLAQAAL
jgi:hypothetical protein